MSESPAPAPSDPEVVVLGAGPAGLSAALNLVRARRRTLVIDSNRPRNAATLKSHGFLTRDGISPLELRRLGREELAGYPEATFVQATVSLLERDGDRTRVVAATRGGETVDVTADVLVLATGLTERFPRLPSLRAFYGTSVHSCVECDGYEYSDAPIALLGETDDLAERAVTLAQWSRDLVVFTNGVGEVTPDDEAALAVRGIRVDRRPVDDVVGDRDGLTGIRLADGEVVPRTGAFVRPTWTPSLDVTSLGVDVDADGLTVVDAVGATSVAGVFAVGDATPPGPQQLIVAAGAGARTAAAVNRLLAAREVAAPVV